MKSSVVLASLLVLTTGVVLASTDPLGGPAPAGAARAADRTDPPLDLLVVRFAPGATPTDRSNALAAAGASAVGAPLPGNRLVVRGDATVAADLRAAPGVAAVWQERLRSTRHVDGGFPRSAAWKDRPPSAPSHGAPFAPPDPWHDMDDVFVDENAPGVWQWEDDRQGVRDVWTTTIGDPDVKVAVIDAGVNGGHSELKATYEDAVDPVTIPCNELVRQYGPLGRMDCSPTDTSGHGTWIAGRIAGAVNG